MHLDIIIILIEHLLPDSDVIFCLLNFAIIMMHSEICDKNVTVLAR